MSRTIKSLQLGYAQSNSRSTDAIGKAACETKETCANTTTHLDAHRPSNKGAAPAGSCLVQLQRDPLAHAEDSRHPFQARVLSFLLAFSAELSLNSSLPLVL